jgi:hypothetical protein
MALSLMLKLSDCRRALWGCWGGLDTTNEATIDIFQLFSTFLTLVQLCGWCLTAVYGVLGSSQMLSGLTKPFMLAVCTAGSTAAPPISTQHPSPFCTF